ncbi:MAG: DUF4388 domain-containing protein [Acidobacteriota bacterium]
MALTGELSDLSLAELIEFFCNQRKTGRLKVVYPIGPGYFYLQAGSVIHARIGDLKGIDAVYCALTLSNASFTFSPAFEAPEQTINQPWTSVVLEGLRRMDEGIRPPNPFVDEEKPAPEPVVTLEAAATPEIQVREEQVQEEKESKEVPVKDVPVKDLPVEAPVTAPLKVPAFVAEAAKESRWRNNPWTFAAVVGAVLLLVAVIGVPWAMYARNKAARLSAGSSAAQPAAAETATSTLPTNETSTAPTPDESVVPAANTAEAEQYAKKMREAHAKDRAKAQENAAATTPGGTQPEATIPTNSVNPSSAKTQSSPSAAGKKVTVQVTYDENGRVTQASGGDATALRIARQKRFPAGKAGTATVTIPIN